MPVVVKKRRRNSFRRPQMIKPRCLQGRGFFAPGCLCRPRRILSRMIHWLGLADKKLATLTLPKPPEFPYSYPVLVAPLDDVLSAWSGLGYGCCEGHEVYYWTFGVTGPCTPWDPRKMKLDDTPEDSSGCGGGCAVVGVLGLISALRRRRR